MKITFVTPNFRNGQRNFHCDVVHITTKWVFGLTLDCNGVFAIKAYRDRPYSRCQRLKPSLVFLNRASYGRRRNNDVTSQEREVTMMLRHDLRTDAQICLKFASQASLFVHHGRDVNRVYCCVHMQTFRTVWFLSNLRLDGKWCLRDDRNAAYIIIPPSLAVVNKHGLHHAQSVDYL